jgi:kynurenine formamidase
MSQYIDLSVPINEETPIYPGDPATKIAKAGDIKKDGYQDHLVSIGTHVGTHMDAPAHMIEGGSNLDVTPIDQFVGRGICIPIQDAFNLDEIKPGDIVLFNTGMDKYYHEPKYFEDYPPISEDVANCLVDKKIKMVGVDMCSPDHDPFPVHKILLGADILIVENLTNLEQLVGKEFKVTALPIKLQIDGAPARVIAELQ